MFVGAHFHFDHWHVLRGVVCRIGYVCCLAIFLLMWWRPLAAQDPEPLPDPVAAMRDDILAAARSGDIENLREPIEWNEIPPVFGSSRAIDPIAELKLQSKLDNGRDILAVLVEILGMKPAHQSPGTVDDMYVWPYLAVTPPANYTAEMDVDALRLVSPGQLREMKQKNTYTHYRLVIGADGVWHFFHKD